MKVFYKKDYEKALIKIKGLKEEIENLNEDINKNEYYYLEKYDQQKKKADRLKEANEEHQALNGILQKENEELKEKIKLLNGSKGGLTKQVNKLANELKEAKALIKEQKKELDKRYIVKKIRGTMPEKQEMQLYSKSKTSEIIRKVKEKL